MPERSIVPVADEDLATIEEIRELFAEYYEWLGEVVCSYRLAEEIANLPGPYAAPSGRLFIARDAAGGVLGCAGVRPHSPGRAEIKRLYVRPAARGTGLGRALAEAAIEAARQLGYVEALISTLPDSMPVAAPMYARMGFVETECFADHDHADEGVTMLYLAKRL
ncbi:MAG TPA: GNAT family N-acetyltransferase [Coriobacteriia bacterium]|nr:GNAT family N-acetyltransferase [Coriobacteriia bacterium]